MTTRKNEEDPRKRALLYENCQWKGPSEPWSPPRMTSAPVLLRKEVIQPHVPVRLPCYDFTPVTDPTFDNSLPCGLGRWLRVEPAPMV